MLPYNNVRGTGVGVGVGVVFVVFNPNVMPKTSPTKEPTMTKVSIY
jgi:hypothetical protein